MTTYILHFHILPHFEQNIFALEIKAVDVCTLTVMICLYTKCFDFSSIILILNRKYYYSCVKIYLCSVYMFIICTMPKSRHSF